MNFDGPEGQNTFKKFDLNDHPYWLVTMGFGAPGVLVGAGEDYAPRVEIQLLPCKNWAQRMSKVRRGANTPFQVDTIGFQRILAKIAHSFAVATIGQENFEPVLPSLILGPTEGKLDQYVGGFRPEEEGRSVLPTTFHHIGISGQDEWLVVRLRLFAFIERTPTYLVVVGKPKI